MERRQFLGLGLTVAAGALVAKTFKIDPAAAADAGKAIPLDEIVTDKDRPGLTITNFCEKPKAKNPNCPNWKPGQSCGSCQFYNTDASKGVVKGKGEHATCQLLLANKKKYVAAASFCENYYQKS